ncbi:MAG: hypothetical protein ACPH67_01685 [Flavobacteriales bacterium]
MKIIKYINFLLITAFVILILLKILSVLELGIKKDTIINPDQSVLVEICSENKLEIGIGAILLLVGLSIYQILKK